MKWFRVPLRLALLSLAAAGFAELTGIYGGSVRSPLPDPEWQFERQNRPSAPQISRFPEFIGEVMGLTICAVAGRITFRLRLSPPSRSKGKPILLDLH